VDANKPFHALNKFGTGFLSKFEAAECKAPILEKITFIDTPGVLSGEKQRIGRSYDYVSVCEWFAERADLILLLFDAHKLDISDEFKRVISTLRGHDDKIRVVLNKADAVSSQQLMRVYGALMWSLGKGTSFCNLKTPLGCRGRHSLTEFISIHFSREHPRSDASIHWIILESAVPKQGQPTTVRGGAEGLDSRSPRLAS
jgi:hypothetical protein